ncbi:hypothetical protein DM01DRAFT_1408205 [Hesseltinella vesiculosa]|uniref:Uncharacterized protein n=1 Tax=Hesseltinella vesiculosa TaxID=101127 RepID=A0A1X2GEY1_9FUNG|nr:hypothetical protein DM01DRAFT_1408205 [Hesseltinella vesiculosa]
MIDANQRTRRDSTPASSCSMEEDTPPVAVHDTPRARRFSEKLLNVARNSPLHRYPSPTWTCMDEDMRSPGRDDMSEDGPSFDMTLSSPLRMTDAPTQWPVHSPISFPTDPMTLVSSPARKMRRLRDKREKQPEPTNDASSLSAKPKRRKLKQQRTTAWRIGPDAVLDTNKVVSPALQFAIAPPASLATSTSLAIAPSQAQHRHNLRNLSQKDQPPSDDSTDDSDDMDLDDSGNFSPSQPSSSQPSSSQPSSSQPKPTITNNDLVMGSWMSSTPKGHQRFRSIRRKDTMENRLNRLLHDRDHLDLSQHTLLPQAAAAAALSASTSSSTNHSKEPEVVIIPDDDDDDVQDPPSQPASPLPHEPAPSLPSEPDHAQGNVPPPEPSQMHSPSVHNEPPSASPHIVQQNASQQEQILPPPCDARPTTDQPDPQLNKDSMSQPSSTSSSTASSASQDDGIPTPPLSAPSSAPTITQPLPLHQDHPTSIAPDTTTSKDTLPLPTDGNDPSSYFGRMVGSMSKYLLG